ncbi:MAG: cell division FtsZ family protein [Verrucomicrobiales bacterium]|nr:cell division FtsZ family protein [Verrucomicrobiales bacterium]
MSAPLPPAGSTPAPAPAPAPAPFGAARIFAIGRAGIEMALDLRQAQVPGFSYVALDSTGSGIDTSAFDATLLVGSRLTRGFGAGGDPELARTAAEEEAPAIRTLCQSHPLVFLIAGLGGGSGTGIAPVVARIARETGASVFAFVTTPFECEGSRRQQQALVGLHRLKTVADGVLCLPNEKLALITDDQATLLDAFQAGRQHIRDAILCIWSLLTRPGLLSVNFADVCSVLRGPNLECAFAQVRTSGPDRAEIALQQLLAHPLLTHNDLVRRAESLLVSFSAGSNLGMGEIRRVMEQFSRKSDGARAVVGASIDPAAGESLQLAVMVSARQMVLHDAPEEAPPERIPSPLHPSSPRTQDLGPARTSRRLAAPPPELTPQVADQFFAQSQPRARAKKKPQQVPLPFELLAKGRFEKCEPTVRRGHNLDQPTYLRRGITLN